jgi:hypothetical protein
VIRSYITLTDGRVMYVPSIVKKKIDQLRIGRGELFTITKAEKKNGTRRTIEEPDRRLQTEMVTG